MRIIWKYNILQQICNAAWACASMRFPDRAMCLKHISFHSVNKFSPFLSKITIMVTGELFMRFSSHHFNRQWWTCYDDEHSAPGTQLSPISEIFCHQSPCCSPIQFSASTPRKTPAIASFVQYWNLFTLKNPIFKIVECGSWHYSKQSMHKLRQKNLVCFCLFVFFSLSRYSQCIRCIGINAAL